VEPTHEGERPSAPSPDHHAPRLVEAELDAALATHPAVSLEGPPEAGKTALAAARGGSVVRLDDPAQRELAHADPTLLVTGTKPIVLAQWHHHPTARDVVRLAARHDPRPGQFVLTGARPRGAHVTDDIASLPVRPLALAERRPDTQKVSLAALLTGAREAPQAESPLALADYAAEVTRSGLPRVRALTEHADRAQALEALVARILDQELPALGDRVRKPAQLRRWLRAVAAASATGTAREQVLAAAATTGPGATRVRPTRATIQPHREALEALGVVDPLPAWQPDPAPLPRLARSPTHHLADPALAAHLLEAEATDLLRGRRAEPPAPTDRALLGLLVTSLVVQSVRVCAQAIGARAAHVRQHSGRRAVPLLVEGANGQVVALTVALGQVADEDAVNELRWFGARLGDRVADLVMVTTGPVAYRRRSDGVAVVPAAALGP